MTRTFRYSLMMTALSGWMVAAIAQEAPIAPATPPTPMPPPATVTLPAAPAGLPSDSRLPSDATAGLANDRSLPNDMAVAAPAPVPEVAPATVAAPAAAPAVVLPTDAVPPAFPAPAAIPVVPGTMLPQTQPPALPSSDPASAAVSIMNAIDDVAALPSVPVAAVAPALDDGSTYSYGTAQNSLLFLPQQIEAMKKALRAFEMIRPDQATGTLQVTEQRPLLVAPPDLKEPSAYPVFYLSSIAYRAADDWTVWVNNTRITPETNDGDLKVSKVTPDRVTFIWNPEYRPIFLERLRRGQLADITPVKHRLTDPPSYGSNAAGINFTLKPNQSFVPGYYRTFEGKVEAPALKPLRESAGLGALTPTEAATINELLGGSPPAELLPTEEPAVPQDRDRQNMDELISNRGRIIPTQPNQAP